MTSEGNLFVFHSTLFDCQECEDEDDGILGVLRLERVGDIWFWTCDHCKDSYPAKQGLTPCRGGNPHHATCMCEGYGFVSPCERCNGSGILMKGGRGLRPAADPDAEPVDCYECKGTGCVPDEEPTV